eukprot:5038882-Alexandrium_andersonii.AAC.1
MSASLVGSEMCIRDRAPGALFSRPPKGIVLGKPFFVHDAFLAGIPLKRAPVSYTHLTLPTICSV